MQPENQNVNPIPAQRPGTEANLRPDIVNNIPIKTPNAPLSPISEDDDLDGIMKEVGKDLHQHNKKPAQRHFFDFKRSPKHPKPSKAHQPAQALPPSQPSTVPALKTKAPSPPRTFPAFTITVTIIITGALITAAYYAYK